MNRLYSYVILKLQPDLGFGLPGNARQTMGFRVWEVPKWVKETEGE